MLSQKPPDSRENLAVPFGIKEIIYMPAHVIQCQYRATSAEEAQTVAAATRKLEGCLYVFVNQWHNVESYFEIAGEVSQEALPEGSRIVPREVMEFLQRHRSGTGEQCPVCLRVNPDNEHLQYEYIEMMKASLGHGLFKKNAIWMFKVVATMLLARGVTEIPNIFGPIRVQIED